MLTDPEKRRIYDQVGEEGLKQGAGGGGGGGAGPHQPQYHSAHQHPGGGGFGGFGGFENIFRNFGGGGGHGHGQPPPEPQKPPAQRPLYDVSQEGIQTLSAKVSTGKALYSNAVTSGTIWVVHYYRDPLASGANTNPAAMQDTPADQAVKSTLVKLQKYLTDNKSGIRVGSVNCKDKFDSKICTEVRAQAHAGNRLGAEKAKDPLLGALLGGKFVMYDGARSGKAGTPLTKVRACVCVRLCVCAYAYACTCKCVCMYVYVCVYAMCMYVCMRV